MSTKTYIEEYIMFDRSEVRMIPNYYIQVKEAKDKKDFVSKDLNVASYRFFKIDENNNKVYDKDVYYTGEKVSLEDLNRRMNDLQRELYLLNSDQQYMLEQDNVLKRKFLVEAIMLSVARCIEVLKNNPNANICYFKGWDDYLVMKEGAILTSSIVNNDNKDIENLLLSQSESFKTVSNVLSSVEEILKASGATYNAIPLAKEELAKVMANNKNIANKYGIEI